MLRDIFRKMKPILKKEIDTSKKGLDLYKWEMGAVLTCDGKGCV